MCFPHEDGEFAARVQTLLDGSHAEWPFAAAVQALLRETYPLVVISPRHEPAGTRVWYAFRDGSAVPDTDGDTIPDGIEVQAGTDPKTNDASADLDQDGVSNLVEFLQGRSLTKGATPDTTSAVNLRVYSPQR